MSLMLASVLFVIFVWWASTGAVLWLVQALDKQMHARLLFMTVVCALGFAGVIIASAHTTVWSVYMAFTSAILIWGWIEFTLLSGLITGSEVNPCPPSISETRRFWLAFKTICYHEYVLLSAMCVLAVLDSTAGSGMAIKTFALLWFMRLGAKLTIFSGVPKLSTNMMPKRLAYMKTYFREDRIGIGFWLSVSCCSLFLAAGIYGLVTIEYSSVTQTQIVMLVTLVSLALLEHVFMVMPFSESSLWRWAMPKARNVADGSYRDKNALPSVKTNKKGAGYGF
ncbi:MAG: putative photosynthetic complex assembly protein PuhE [Pseudomonadota bacterium]